jgi:hypothetical protein
VGLKSRAAGASLLFHVGNATFLACSKNASHNLSPFTQIHQLRQRQHLRPTSSPFSHHP